MRRRGELLLHLGALVDEQMLAARDRLVGDVLDLDAGRVAAPWHPFCYFAANGDCVANVEAAILPLVADGAKRDVAAIRAIAVDPGWRGQGLFRDLMSEALAWCDSRSAGSTLLYTEEPVLYRRFGFEPVPQHAFVGAPPTPRPGPTARRLKPRAAKDAALIRRAIERRAPISMRCALLVDGPSFAANLAQDTDLAVAYSAELDAIVVHEIDDDLLTLVDIVAAKVPRLASVIGALGVAPRRVKTLFPPDQLGWDGTPVAEDTGLMLRGHRPAAMAQPFMFAPTSEF